MNERRWFTLALGQAIIGFTMMLFVLIATLGVFFIPTFTMLFGTSSLYLAANTTAWATSSVTVGTLLFPILGIIAIMLLLSSAKSYLKSEEPKEFSPS